jgi:broad specificity phosphatase PhoE
LWPLTILSTSDILFLIDCKEKGRLKMGSDHYKTTVILIRHGECKGNREGLFRGRYDFPLNDNGKSQAKAIAHEIAQNFKLDKIYSSPLSRALETAQTISSVTNIPTEIRNGFNNISLGPWEGRPKREIKEEFPEEWNLWLRNPERLRLQGAETISDVQRRAFANLNHLIKVHQGSTFAIVTHRAVLKPLIAGALGIPEPYFWKIHVDTASYSVLTHDPQKGYCLILLNQTRHLKNFISEWE